MKRKNKLFLYSLTSLAVVASSAAFAEQFVTVPTLEGGVTASVGVLLASPSADAQDYGTYVNTTTHEAGSLEVNTESDWGLDASLGYVFEDTANSVELSYIWFNTDANDSIDNSTIDVFGEENYDAAESQLSYEFDSLDLMFNQFVNLGANTQVRLGIGATFLDLEKEQSSAYYDSNNSLTSNISSQYSGVGPRVSIDGRYGFHDSGWGVLAGGSLGYLVGDLDYKDNLQSTTNPDAGTSATTIDNASIEDSIDSHGVTNIRANVAVDYVYFMDDEDLTTVGLELGYMFDYYDNAILQSPGSCGTLTGDSSSGCEVHSNTVAFSFSGPYLNLKGVF